MSKWIKCSEQLPKDINGIYICAFKYQDIDEDSPRWIFRIFKFNGIKFDTLGLPVCVTHWQPFPDPPEE